MKNQDKSSFYNLSNQIENKMSRVNFGVSSYLKTFAWRGFYNLYHLHKLQSNKDFYYNKR